MRRDIKSPQRQMRTEHFIVTDVAGTPTLGEGQYRGTIADNAPGDFTITLNEPMGRAPVVLVTPASADTIAIVAASAIGSVQINLVDATDGTTLKDGDCHILLLGSEVADEA